jgi:hypothetical protein
MRFHTPPSVPALVVVVMVGSCADGAAKYRKDHQTEVETLEVMQAEVA